MAARNTPNSKAGQATKQSAATRSKSRRAKAAPNSAKTARFTRKRHPKALPLRPEENCFPFARSRTEFKGLPLGSLVQIIMDTPEWEQHVGLRVDAVDAQLSPRERACRRYTHRELEQVHLLRILLGHERIQDTRSWLAGDLGGATRRIFGFEHAKPDHIRDRYRPVQLDEGEDRRRDGVPSERSLTRHIERIGIEHLMEWYERCFDAIVAAHFDESPEMRKAARILFVDGSGVESHYTAPHWRKRPDDTWELVNERAVTAWHAGSTGNAKRADKNGDGWNLVTMHAVDGLAVAYA